MTIDIGHARTTDPETSHKAAKAQQSRKQYDMALVFALIRDADEPPTAAEIAVGLMETAYLKAGAIDALPEMYRRARMVSRRVSDLAQAEDGRPDIESAGVRKCDVTGAEATTWRVCPKQETLL